MTKTKKVTKKKVAKKATKKNENIFIQIAAYRDPELLPTLKHCLENADKPENLRFCIAWQHTPEDTWDTLEEYYDDPRFIILDIPYMESKGTCWARNLIQQYWDGEAYTLQLDSHHRFVEGWDTLLIGMVKDLQKAGHKKPLLTAYVTSYSPKNWPEGSGQGPWYLTFDRFTPQGAMFFIPSVVPDWENRTLAYPSRFYSAHFAFTVGEFCKEVPHDPNYLFHGEEISIAARAYTWGYDLFAPHRVCVYHEYSREHRPRKSWDDLPQWGVWDKDSHARHRRLLNIDGEAVEGEDFGPYGFGKVRTLAEYEAYAGVRFIDRSVQQYTLNHGLPPNPADEPFNRVFKHCIDVPFDWVPHNDYNVWAVAFENKDGKEIYRQDVYPDEIKRMKSDPVGYCKLWRTFHASEQPRKWVVWPHSEEHGWGPRYSGNI